MKDKKKISDRQLIVKSLKLNVKTNLGIKAVEEAILKRTNNNWYSRKEAANYIGVSTKQLDRYRQYGKIKAYQPITNGYVRYQKAVLDKFLKLS